MEEAFSRKRSDNWGWRQRSGKSFFLVTMWWLRIDLQKAIRSQLLSNEGSTFSKALRQRRKLYCAVYSFLSKRSCVGVVRSEVCRCRHLGLTPAFWQDFFCVVRTCWVAVDLKEATRSQLLSNWRGDFSNAPKQLSTMNCAVCSILLGRSCVVFGSNTKRAWCFSVSASQSLLTQRAIFSWRKECWKLQERIRAE